MDVEQADGETVSELGSDLHRFVAELYPYPRSVTGEGVRKTLSRIAERIPLVVHEVPTGTPVLDWTVPKEWNIRDAYVENARGERVIDFRKHTLHVVNSSVPVRATMSLDRLKQHLHSLPERPDWIPYRYSHYGENWGFCLRHRDYEKLEDEEYGVCIDTTLEEGSLSYGECLLPGRSAEEVLVSTHVCHPSLANDNLSGVAVSVFLAREVAGWKERRYSYRFVFAPGTIGAITWLARNEAGLSRIRHGLVLSGLGDRGASTYKKSRRGDAEIDRAAVHVLRHSGRDYEILDFAPYGYDERQYNSPGFDLPVGLLMRTPHDRYPEYHTSADDLEFVRPDALEDSLRKCSSIFSVLERNERYVSRNPKGEPNLGRRGLYRLLSGQADRRRDELPLLWVLNFSDGAHSLLDIAEKAEIPFALIRKAADRLLACDLLDRAEGQETGSDRGL